MDILKRAPAQIQNRVLEFQTSFIGKHNRTGVTFSRELVEPLSTEEIHFLNETLSRIIAGIVPKMIEDFSEDSIPFEIQLDINVEHGEEMVLVNVFENHTDQTPIAEMTLKLTDDAPQNFLQPLFEYGDINLTIWGVGNENYIITDYPLD